MSKDSLANFAEQQEWLAPVEQPLADAVRAAFQSLGPGGQKVRNAFHGTWLGHPVHVVLTDVPVGAWTAAVIFDAMASMGGQRKLNFAADASVAVGLIGAVGAAVTGLNDWAEIDDKPRRVGLVHGLLNLGAAALFTGSLVARQRKSRSTARGLAVLGYVVATASAKLGGTLVYDYRIGVDHSREKEPPSDFVPVLSDHDLAEDHPTRVMADGSPVLLVRRQGQIFGLAETCSHLGGPLSEGKLDGDSIQCPWHGSRFSLETGEVLDGPAVHPQTCVEARVHDGKIEVRRRR